MLMTKSRGIIKTKQKIDYEAKKTSDKQNE